MFRLFGVAGRFLRRRPLRNFDSGIAPRGDVSEDLAPDEVTILILILCQVLRVEAPGAPGRSPG